MTAPKPPEEPLWCDPTEPHPLRNGCFRSMHSAELAALREHRDRLDKDLRAEHAAAARERGILREQLAQAQRHNALLHAVARSAEKDSHYAGFAQELEDAVRSARAGGALP